MDRIETVENLKEYKIRVENAVLFLLIAFSLAKQDDLGDEAERVARGMHSHLYAELFVCKVGRTVVHTANESISLCRGDVVILPSGVEHYCTDTCGTVRYTLSFDCKESPLRDGANVFSMLRCLCDTKAPIVQRNTPELAERLVSVMENVVACDTFANRLAVVQLLLTVAEQAFQTGKTASTHRELDINRLSVIDSVIHTDYTTDVCAADVAKMLFISERQLARIVKQRYGCSLKQAITQKRVAVAKQLLRETDMSVEQIGYSVGFATRANFYRAFGAQLGVTPKEYRESRENN